MINLKQIRDIVFQIFSDSGYSVNSINIKFPQPLNIKITQSDKEISLDFLGDVPKFSWKKLITWTAHIQGVSLRENNGTLKLRYLPDIDFNYNNTSELAFGHNNVPVDLSSIEGDIYAEFQDEARQKLANRCLQYGVEWATIASQNENFFQSSTTDQKKLKQQCKNFIRDNIKNEEEKFGSVILTFILLYVLLPVVLKFIVERIFRKLFS